MTGSARRQPNRRAQVRLAPRTRAAIAALRIDRPRPRRAPVGRILLAAVAAIVVVAGALGGMGVVVGTGLVANLTEELPEANLDSLTFAQPTIVYDRTGTVELARFEREKRRVVAYEEVPKLVLDATTTAEDRTFWRNDGYDPAAIAAAAVQNVSGESSDERGASTITQQLVRARFLPAEVVESGDRYRRKVLEVLQASRLTAAYPGEAGKERIITAYLNEIYYGHRAYGVAAAASIYFGVDDLADLTPAQAALLAGLPKAPSTYDPYRYAEEDEDGRLVVPADSPPVVRRDYILRGLAAESRWTALSPAELESALAEPVVLVGDQPRKIRAGHFVWQVRDELEQLLGGRDAVETGGYRVLTTLDWNAQKLAEKYVYASSVIPQLPYGQARKEMRRLDLGAADRGWVNNLRGKDLHNGALVAIDYRTGDVIAYVGSGSYERTDLRNKRFQPQYDVASAYRQPGSAFKPIVYATAFEQHALTPGSLLLDISTDFGGWTPKNADRLDRGPVRVRQALQLSLNLPAIRALERVGNEPTADVAQGLGVQFLNGRKAFLQSGLAGAIGTVETRPIDLTAAFGSLGNGGVHVPTRMVLSIDNPDGTERYRAPDPAGTQAISKQSAWLISDILDGNTNMNENRFWAATLELRNTKNGSRRPAAVKTGTADNNMDFGAYGYLAPPKDPDAVALAVGIWMGNSDHSAPRTSSPPTSLAASGEVWHAFVREYSKNWPIAEFQRPKDIVEARIDRWSGGRPGPWTRSTVNEFFIAGTQPGAKGEIDPAGLLYSQGCGGWVVDPVSAELGPARWDDDIAAWVSRARRGPGVRGPYGSTTAYWFGEGSWGGPLAGPCPVKKDKGDGKDSKGDGKGHGNDKPKPPKPDEPPGGNGGNGDAVLLTGGIGGAGDLGGLLPFVPLLTAVPAWRLPVRRRPVGGRDVLPADALTRT
jgi:membrane peptidoglycan carboxypeptidase